MSLRTLAEKDLGNILADKKNGFGFDITIVDQQGTSWPFVGFANDIAQVIDPDTGLYVSGRIATVAIRLTDLALVNLTVPHKVSDESVTPWKVIFNDIGGQSHSFTIRQSMPDRAIGCLILILEAYV